MNHFEPSDPDGIGLDDPRVSREWLVTNGLGGYASGTVSGLLTRRFHGLLVAALPAPDGRTMMLNHLLERVRRADGRELALVGSQKSTGPRQPLRSARLAEFRWELSLPLWRYELADDGVNIEKSLFLLRGQNTVLVNYTLRASKEPVNVELEPWINFRPHEGSLSTPIDEPYALNVFGDRYEVSRTGMPALRLKVWGEKRSFVIAGDRLSALRYRIEQSRGYDAVGDLYSPGYFTITLSPDMTVTFIGSTEPWEVIESMTPVEAFACERLRRRKLLSLAAPSKGDSTAEQLILAADQFVIRPAGRVADAARARAAGDGIRTIVAGYHWFTDWGRDTMISLEGLTLTTGRWEEAGYILRTFSHYVKDGLIPNLFPEGRNAGLYHTADATLWFFHAIDRYLRHVDDEILLRHLVPIVRTIVEHHLAGTRFGIHVDPRDGLLSQGQEGFQLTWMDAKVGDYVVTPRRGKAVEINALWYNALKLLEGWVTELEGPEAARRFGEHAARAKEAFNRRFWNEQKNYLFDVVDGENGNDDALRPNQLLAISLAHPVLDPGRWAPVLDAVEKSLVTPVGLRSLSPSHPDYKPNYFGDLRARDLAYHQGTVWAWLVGPFIDAWLKVHPGEERSARRFLEGFVPHLSEACAGTISEIFDAEPPFTPRGCVAQAWSVAEVLRCWVRTAAPARPSSM